jgi:hypothetical protein
VIEESEVILIEDSDRERAKPWDPSHGLDVGRALQAVRCEVTNVRHHADE